MWRLTSILAAAGVASAVSAEPITSSTSTVSLSLGGGTATAKINGEVVDSVSVPPGTRSVKVQARSRAGQPPEVSIEIKPE